MAQARALMRLRNTPEFQQIREWLADSLSDTDTKLRSADGTTLARYQGKAQCLETLLDKIDNADRIAEKIDKHSGRSA